MVFTGMHISLRARTKEGYLSLHPLFHLCKFVKPLPAFLYDAPLQLRKAKWFEMAIRGTFIYHLEH